MLIGKGSLFMCLQWRGDLPLLHPASTGTTAFHIATSNTVSHKKYRMSIYYYTLTYNYMPAKSKQQFKFMKAIETGSIKAPGLSKKEAEEYTKGQSPKNLPMFSKIKNILKK
jgi:hypothetical protein